MGKGREQEELSLNSPDCEMVYCLLSHTASKKREDEEHQNENDLDLFTVSASWISLTLCLVGTGTQGAREEDTTPADQFFKALESVSPKRYSKLKTRHWDDLCFLFGDGYSSVQWAPWHSAKQRSRPLENCGWPTTSSKIKKKCLIMIPLFSHLSIWVY